MTLKSTAMRRFRMILIDSEYSPCIQCAILVLNKSKFMEGVILQIDFTKIESMTFPGMNNGTGTSREIL